MYPRSGHLLCHDDVIGTRCISYIVYLTAGTCRYCPQGPERKPGASLYTRSRLSVSWARCFIDMIVEPSFLEFHGILLGGEQYLPDVTFSSSSSSSCFLHLLHHIFDPCFLTYVASYDVVSNVWQALPGGPR